MSNQNNMNKRIDDLFADLKHNSNNLPYDEAKNAPAWEWRCDSQAKYTSCSPEVGAILNMDAQAFLGQPLASFGLAPESQQQLKTILKAKQPQSEARIRFQTANGNYVLVRMHILYDEAKREWHGFNQIIQNEGIKQPPITNNQKPDALPPTPSGRTTYSTLSGQNGVAVEDNQVISVSSPYSSTGEHSLRARQTLAHAASPESPAALAVPMEIQQQALGLLEIIDDAPNRQWSQDEQRLVEDVASQLSLALENAQLFASQQRRAQEMSTLHDISVTLSQQQLDIDAVLEIISRRAMDLLNADGGGVWLWQEEDQELELVFSYQVGDINTTGRRLKPGEGLTGLAFTKRKLQTVDNYADWPGKSEIFQDLHFHANLTAPLIWQNEALGVLDLTRSQANQPFTPNEQNLAQLLANQASAIIRNATLFNEIQYRSEELETINRVVSQVATSLDLEESLQVIANVLGQSLNIQTGITLLDESGSTLTVVADYSPNPDRPTAKGVEIPVSGNPSTEKVLETKKPVIIENAQKDPLTAPIHNIMRQHNVRSIAIFPLIAQDEVIGTVGLDILEEGRSFKKTEIQLVETIIAQAATAIQNSRLFEQIQTRSTQLQAAAEVSRAASSILEPNPLIQQTVNLIRDHFDLYYVGIFLVDESGIWSGQAGRWAVLRAGTGEPGRIQVSRVHKLEISAESMIGQCISNATANISQLAPEEARRFANPLLPKTQSEMALPLISRGDVIGAMTIQSTEPNAFTEEDISVFQTMADQVANALQNANLYDQTQKNTQELTILNEMGQSLSSQLNTDEIIQTIYQFVSRLMDTSYFFVALSDESEKLVSFPLVVENNRQSQIPPMLKGEGLTQHVIDTKEPLLTGGNTEQVIKDLGLERIVVGEPATSWLGVPMLIGEKVLGIISVQSVSSLNIFTEHHRELLLGVARQSAIAIQNADLFAQIQRQLSNISTIQEITSDLSAALTLDGVINTLLAHLASAVNIDISSIFNLEGNYLVRTNIYPASEENLLSIGEKLPLSDYPLTQNAIETQKPLAISADDARLEEHERKAFASYGIAINAIIPIVSPTGTLGIVSINRYHPASNFTDEEINLINTLVTQAAVAIQNARLYEEQLETAEELRELDKLKLQFLANMSHELRTPLNSIIGFSRVIMKGIDGPVTEQQNQDLSAIYNAGQHLLIMINDILDISKIDAGKMELAFEDVELQQIVESVLATVRGLVKDKPIELITSIPDNLPLVRGDPTRIRQILLNLISNSAKFTEEGSITITARQQTSSEGKPEIYISIIDTGIGIATDDQEDLFEPFTQVDGSPTRRTGGTGLGLSITRLLVDLHGGRIGIDSKVGKGSTFYFTLPLTHDETVTIMAIEGSDQIVEVYQHYLVDTKYQIIPVTDPSDAVKLALELQPFAITLDLTLPNHNGWDILRDLTQDAGTSHIPIIICSIKEAKEKALEMGAADYLLKPILKNDLIDALNRIDS
ncbi:MAG: GAF domain-containing protein [Chloroflexota bacterium]|nr:GAF domain-containing protein [Chloroflexota bacterium]